MREPAGGQNSEDRQKETIALNRLDQPPGVEEATSYTANALHWFSFPLCLCPASTILAPLVTWPDYQRGDHLQGRVGGGAARERREEEPDPAWVHTIAVIWHHLCHSSSGITPLTGCHSWKWSRLGEGGSVQRKVGGRTEWHHFLFFPEHFHGRVWGILNFFFEGLSQPNLQPGGSATALSHPASDPLRLARRYRGSQREREIQKKERGRAILSLRIHTQTSREEKRMLPLNLLRSFTPAPHSVPHQQNYPRLLPSRNWWSPLRTEPHASDPGGVGVFCFGGMFWQELAQKIRGYQEQIALLHSKCKMLTVKAKHATMLLTVSDVEGLSDGMDELSDEELPSTGPTSKQLPAHPSVVMVSGKTFPWTHPDSLQGHTCACCVAILYMHRISIVLLVYSPRLPTPTASPALDPCLGW